MLKNKILTRNFFHINSREEFIEGDTINYVAELSDDRNDKYFYFSSSDYPSVISYNDGSELWYFNNALHRAAGPAIFGGKNKYCIYYVNGKFYPNKIEWYAALSQEDKYIAVWHLNGN